MGVNKKNAVRRTLIAEAAKNIGLEGKIKKKKLIREYVRTNAKTSQMFERLTDSAINKLIDLDILIDVNKDTKLNEKAVVTSTKKPEIKPFVLSAWNTKTGLMMDIDTYCDFYKLPRKDIKSYKLVSHTGTPYYNILFKENIEDIESDRTNDEYLESLEKSLKEQFSSSRRFLIAKNRSSNIGIINISDLHVGMCTNKDGNSLWATSWDRENIMRSITTIIKHTEVEQGINGIFDYVVINLTGDLVDGYNQETTRGTHKLPQWMSNIEQSDVCVEAVLRLVNGIIATGTKVYVFANSNSNHGGSFEHITLQKIQLQLKYEYQIEMVLTNKLALGYTLPGTNKQIVIFHGKDQEFMARPMPAYIEDKDDYKIEAIIDAVHNTRNNLKPIVFKGDSHRFVSQEKKNFHWVANSACSPDSDWVKNNFYAAGTGNCTFATYNKNTDTLSVGNIKF